DKMSFMTALSEEDESEWEVDLPLRDPSGEPVAPAAPTLEDLSLATRQLPPGMELPNPLYPVPRSQALKTDTDLLFVPPPLRIQTNQWAHGLEHAGARKTWNKVKRNYFWPGMHKEIQDYVASCMVCLTQKRGPEKRQGLMGHLSATGPLDLLQV